MAAGHSVTVDPARWQELFDQVIGRVAGRFARVELRRRARAFVRGLLADLPRKNCWTLAEHAGDASPDGMQYLLARAVWDADAVRDDVRALLVEHLGDPGAVLVVDETGDLKKGAHTVGVQRQYTGTAGKVDNAQVAVYLAYATDAGHGVIDRELYLPQRWLDDPQRCRAAGVPEQRRFATKPELARVMLERALDARVPAGWVTADEVYGGSPALRGWLETRQLPYVLAVKATAGPRRSLGMSVHASVVPRVARGRAGSRAWWRRAAARLTGPARPSAPIARLRKVAMTCGAVPVRSWQASSASVVSRRWCGRSRSPSARGGGRRGGRGWPGRTGGWWWRRRPPPASGRGLAPRSRVLRVTRRTWATYGNRRGGW